MVRPGEGPVAFLALERPMTRVFPVVASELIGTCKLPAAALPVAVVRLLPCDKKKQKNTHTPRAVSTIRKVEVAQASPPPAKKEVHPVLQLLCKRPSSCI